jgi:tetratricopeptide (TPR) repeat protein
MTPQAKFAAFNRRKSFKKGVKAVCFLLTYPMNPILTNMGPGPSIWLNKGDMISDREYKHSDRDRPHNFRRPCKRLRQTPADHPEALHRSGIIAFQAGDPTTALDLIFRAIRQHPQVASYHNNLGLVLESVGNRAEALHACQTALKLQPDYADAYNNLGNALRQQKRMDEAMENFQTALGIAPDFPEAHFNQALTYRDSGQLEAAIDHYRQAIRYKPDYAKAYNGLGNAALMRRLNISPVPFTSSPEVQIHTATWATY